MEHCIGQIVRWSKKLVQPICDLVQSEGPRNQFIHQFNFQSDDPLQDVGRTSNTKQQFESADTNEDHVSSRDPERRTCNVIGVDGLPTVPPRRGSKKTRRVTEDKGARKIG